jgi:hypothetical protein
MALRIIRSKRLDNPQTAQLPNVARCLSLPKAADLRDDIDLPLGILHTVFY